MLPRLITEYRKFRGLVIPDGPESFLFFLSEVGELAEAYLGTLEDPDFAVQFLLAEMHELGQRADETVSRYRTDWVRNGDRKKAPNVEYEIGDTLFMLTSFAMALGINPAIAMLRKMESKEFEYDLPDDELALATVSGILFGDDGPVPTNTDIIRAVRDLVRYKSQMEMRRGE